ncbi:MAG: hypothetical protein ACREKL_11355, partial [Chthoniobacterales bacterium]
CELWSSTGWWGKHVLRKWERKFFLSFEYAAKALYGGLIRFASHSVYGLADTEVYMTVKSPSADIFKNPEVRKFRDLGAQGVVITVPHYQGFTDTVPALARQGVDFLDVAGTDEILLTVVAPADWKYDLKAGAPLFTMEILTGEKSKRVAIQAPIRDLGTMLRDLQARGIPVEHLYDY